MIRSTLPLLALGLAACATAQNPAPATTSDASFRERAPSEEVVYFVLPDRFENGDTGNDTGDFIGDRLTTGFDPSHKGFYHGGDLAGLTQRLDYIEGLGITAIWFAPIFQNKPVQGPAGDESAGYHGYWVTDFTRPDGHFGTREEFKVFVDAAHARGMKVYMDIITNHTADVIRYAEGDETGYVYRSKGDFPYSRKGGVDGPAINPGFMGDEDRGEANFAKLTDPTYAYTPVVPATEKDVKVPAWLNDPTNYHNRGDSTFAGESSTYGDFVGLDDLFTEQPDVVDGMTDIYRAWVDLGIDGFRIDTAKHVNTEFWQEFAPAIREHAASVGNDDFFAFGEVYDANPAYLSQFSTIGRLDATLDFGFQDVGLGFAKGGATTRLRDFYAADDFYTDADSNAYASPTFLGNHDMGRIGTFLQGGDAVLERAAEGLACEAGKGDHGDVGDLPPVLAVRFRAGGLVYPMFSTIAQFGTADDIALADLKIEMFFPSDENCEALFRAMAD